MITMLLASLSTVTDVTYCIYDDPLLETWRSRNNNSSFKELVVASDDLWLVFLLYGAPLSKPDSD